MHRRRRHSEVALHISFRRRETVDLHVVVDEREVLALLQRVRRLRISGFRETFGASSPHILLMIAAFTCFSSMFEAAKAMATLDSTRPSVQASLRSRP
jgi:hypothetical protein